VIEQIVEGSGTPFFAFKDIDENRSLGSIRIRIETIDYFLRRYRERQLPAWRTSAEIDRHLREYERTLRLDLVGQETLPDGKSARMVIENENVRG
jgi:hypothetical protein